MKQSLAALAMPLVLGLACATQAQDVPGCAELASGLAAVNGYEVTIPPAGPDQGWCVLDEASFRSQTPGWPNLGADRLRLKQSATGIALDLTGLRVTPRLGDREVDDRVRALMRLQTADLQLLATHDPSTSVLTVSELLVKLSSGTMLRLEAEIRDADLTPASLLAGAVTSARVEWRNDGRFLRPVLELAGERVNGTSGVEAVDAARMALSGLVAALPEAAVDSDSRDALEAVVAALPQGRGRLTLAIASEDGIGAARIAVAVLTGDPLSAQALAALFDGATITADWQPGLEP